MKKALVTGGSGFLGSHCIIQLLSEGYNVKATVRSLAKANDTRDALVKAGALNAADIEFIEADLAHDDGWNTAVEGCDYVLHAASPFPTKSPNNENDLILPAKDGSLRVLRASRRAGVKRVVMTSSFAAIGYGRKIDGRVYTESDWTDLAAPNPPYIRSKTIAEKAAWDFIETEGNGLELAVINPVGIFGPVLGPDYAASIAIIKGMLEGAITGLPDVYFSVVDVRDVADLHIRAMSNSQAKGERFIASAGELLSMAHIAGILRRRLGAKAGKVTTKRLPSWQVRLAAIVSQSARQTLPNLGKRRPSSNEKSQRLLGWQPRSSEEVIVATAESLFRMGLIAASV